MDWGDTGGGGFMNDSVMDNEPQQVAGSVSVGGEDKSKSVVACSVSQITKLTRPNEGLVLHGKKVYHVNLVALVYEILEINSQKIHILVDDYTGGGPLELTHIFGDSGTVPEQIPDQGDGMMMENQPKSLHDLKQGDYFRCIGVVKYAGDKANLVAYNLKIIEDPNEVTAHTLEVIRDSMIYERSSSGVEINLNGNKDKMGEGMQADSNVPMYQQQQQQNGNSFGKLSTRDKHLLKFLKEKGGEAGIKIENIQANFKAFSPSDIMESLQVLCTEGLVWQGDQEDIWCCGVDF